jgi:hypothetical protein
LTDYYLQSGQFDDPELARQVEASEALLNQTIAGTTGGCSLGNLLAAANIPRFNQLPIVQEERSSMKLLEGGQP